MSRRSLATIGVTFALVFVASLSVLIGSVTISAQMSNNELVKTLSRQNIVEEGDIVKGELVAVMLNNLSLLDDSISCTIVVKTKENTKGKEYTIVRRQGKVYEGSDTRSKDYINPSGDFIVGYNTNENGLITSIEFKQQ